MNTELHKKLRAALLLTTPDIGKEYLYDRCINKYIAAMLPAISNALACNYKSTALHANQFYFSQSKIREEVGTVGKEQQYIYELMKANTSTNLLPVVMKGFNQNGKSQLSIVKINDIYKDLVMEELLNLKIETNGKLLDEIEQNANYVVDVDPVSLASFIEKTSDTLRATKGSGAYAEKLLRNLAAARQLQSMIHPANAMNATPFLKERWEMADSGRIYGQGYSLQRMPKEVRHAALGVCHKYDFKACAFAIMAGLAHAINPTLKINAILDYIKNRAKIRQRIAANLNVDETVVKTIFTALGFGAELKNNQFNAIRGALAKAARMQHDENTRLPADVYNGLGADEFKRLIENQTFCFIYEALEQINATILAHFSMNDFTIGCCTYCENDPNTGKKRSSKQKLAWIYQAYESQAMQAFAELAEQEPLLTTHDCLYFKQKLSTEQTLSITTQLQETFPYLRFEHEAIYPITTDAAFEERFKETVLEDATHKQRIEEQERLGKCHMRDAKQNNKPTYAAGETISHPMTKHEQLINCYMTLEQNRLYIEQRKILLEYGHINHVLECEMID
ncbi:hypothetical protein ACO0KY_18685 [Undibacterium sp. Dicai25W]|uniref:hypothetical protein n=1 Tax=Undibacterium sp. Dicai25W TaxID=3413034 RepID=UPI003BF1BC47